MKQPNARVWRGVGLCVTIHAMGLAAVFRWMKRWPPPLCGLALLGWGWGTPDALGQMPSGPGDGPDRKRSSAARTRQPSSQKEGSRGQNFAFEGFVGSHYGAQTLVRVRAEIVALAAGSHRLQCRAFIVTGAGDSFFEEEKPLSNMRSGPYQRLLDKVQASLK